MIGKVVTCVWAGQGKISTGRRYEIIDHRESEGLVKVIGDDGQLTPWLLDSYFELSGENILTVENIEIEGIQANEVSRTIEDATRVIVTLTDSTQWIAIFHRLERLADLPERIAESCKENTAETEVDEFTQDLHKWIIKWEVHRLLDSGEFYFKFEKPDKSEWSLN